MNYEFKNILIVRTDRIGDVILTTPAIKAVRDAFPRALISILVAESTKELVIANTCIDEVIVDDRRNRHRGPFGFLQLVRMIKAKRFDLAIIYHTKKRTNLACFLAGIPARIGYKDRKFGFLLNRPIRDDRHLGQKHEAQYCLDLLRAIGVESNDLGLYLPVSEEALIWADNTRVEHGINEDKRLIAVHAGASDPSKRWSEKGFAELIDKMAQRHKTQAIIIGAAENTGISKKICSLATSPVTDLTGQTSVGQMAALLMRCDLLVSNDSGPVHVAAAVGTPVVSIFTRNQPGINPERWRPLGEHSRVVCVKSSPTGQISFKKAGSFPSEYMELIATDEVLEAVDALLKLC